MGQKEQKGKKGKNRRKNPVVTSRYWNSNMPVNMCKRAIRVYKRIHAMSHRALLRDNKYHLEEIADEANRRARLQAMKCASAHGPIVEAGLARWLRGEPAFERVKTMKGQSVIYVERA